VYVMAPYDCSQSTMDSIDERLKKESVTFFCGAKLVDLFKENYPELLVFNSSLLSSYVAKLKRGLDDDNPLKIPFRPILNARDITTVIFQGLCEARLLPDSQKLQT